MSLLRPLLRAPSRFFSGGHSHGGVPCSGSHAAPYHELSEGAQTLASVLSGSPKALVYFTASWCGPCRKIAPHFSNLAAEHGGSVKFVKVDVDANQGTAEAANVSSIPTFVSYVGGKATSTFTGANPATLTSAVKALL